MTQTARGDRFDTTLRVVMWLDAFLSVGIVLVGVLASPVLAVMRARGALLEAVALTSVVTAVLLAAFGAITAVVLMLRMREGVYRLPPRLWLPLPPGMGPATGRW